MSEIKVMVEMMRCPILNGIAALTVTKVICYSSEHPTPQVDYTRMDECSGLGQCGIQTMDRAGNLSYDWQRCPGHQQWTVPYER